MLQTSSSRCIAPDFHELKSLFEIDGCAALPESVVPGSNLPFVRKQQLDLSARQLARQQLYNTVGGCVAQPTRGHSGSIRTPAEVLLLRLRESERAHEKALKQRDALSRQIETAKKEPDRMFKRGQTSIVNYHRRYQRVMASQLKQAGLTEQQYDLVRQIGSFEADTDTGRLVKRKYPGTSSLCRQLPRFI